MTRGISVLGSRPSPAVHWVSPIAGTGEKRASDSGGVERGRPPLGAVPPESVEQRLVLPGRLIGPIRLGSSTSS